MASPGALPSNRRLLLSLVLLAALLPETITGSTPPEKWLNPLQALFNVWLYGAGVLAVREISVRWKIGYPGILVLGAAYGILEEGLAVTTFFNPTLPQFADNALGSYGRWLGVNWVWAVWLTTFHAIVSIAMPIFLVESHWPALNGRRLLSNRGLAVDLVLLGACVMTINLAVHAASPYVEDPLVYVGAVLAIALLVWAARAWADRGWARLPVLGIPFARRGYGIAGFLSLLTLFLIYSGGPSVGGVPEVTILEGLAVTALVVLVLRGTTRSEDRVMERSAFVAGAILMFCAFDLVLAGAGHLTMILPALAVGSLVAGLYREGAVRARPAGPKPSA